MKITEKLDSGCRYKKNNYEDMNAELLGAQSCVSARLNMTLKRRVNNK